MLVDRHNQSGDRSGTGDAGGSSLTLSAFCTMSFSQ
jgi:hypothetical protein